MRRAQGAGAGPRPAGGFTGGAAGLCWAQGPPGPVGSGRAARPRGAPARRARAAASRRGALTRRRSGAPRAARPPGAAHGHARARMSPTPDIHRHNPHASRPWTVCPLSATTSPASTPAPWSLTQRSAVAVVRGLPLGPRPASRPGDRARGASGSGGAARRGAGARAPFAPPTPLPPAPRAPARVRQGADPDEAREKRPPGSDGGQEALRAGVGAGAGPRGPGVAWGGGLWP
jgi:hypothetical protein